MALEIRDLFNLKNFSKKNITDLLCLGKREDIELLFNTAESIRKDYCGDEVHIRGIIEFSNFCRRNCRYCGLRRNNKKLKRYRISPDEIVQISLHLADMGIRTVVLQSGEDLRFSQDLIANIIYNIKIKTDMAVTLSVGERSYETYRRWFNAGADRYLLKHETINPGLYKILHPDMGYKERLRCLDELKKIGYQVGAGIIVNVPGQTIEDIADDIIFLKKIDADMAGIGPFIPHPDTPLGNNPPGSVELTLKTLAVARIILKNIHLPATTALETLDSKGYEKGLSCGANVIMPNFTPYAYRTLYEIYPGKSGSILSGSEILKNVRKRVHSSGLIISKGRGDSLKRNK